MSRRGTRKVLMTFFLAIIVVVLALAVMSFAAPRPGNLGVSAGKLAPCPSSPNCICSQDPKATHAIEPLAFADSPQAAWKRLRQVVTAMPRTTIVTENDGYLHAEFLSFIFRFVDDVEFTLDADQGVIHCRSASRVGHSDLGVNRRRIEAIRREFSAAPLTPSP